ncbi:MAG: hypothetical protein ACYTG7_15570 [Planctomycetota bacterium]|jgi:hypothetical protein
MDENKRSKRNESKEENQLLGRRSFLGRVTQWGIVGFAGTYLVFDVRSGNLAAARGRGGSVDPQDPEPEPACACDCYCACECDCGCGCKCECDCENKCESQCTCRGSEGLKQAMNINIDTNVLNTAMTNTSSSMLSLLETRGSDASIDSAREGNHKGVAISNGARLQVYADEIKKGKKKEPQK